MGAHGDPDGLVEVLWRAGFVAAEEEAAELRARAGADAGRLADLVARRLTGEPLAWVTGSTTFCDLVVPVDTGVYVPRAQTEPLARRAAERLPDDGAAVDLCTGAGAIALVLAARRPRARIVGTDLDERAVACARANGVDARRGDLFGPVPAELRGHVDVVVASVPYVPTAALALLPRDTLAFESAVSYDGGPDGTDVLRRAIEAAAGFLRPGGALVLELGGEQAELLAPTLAEQGYVDVAALVDEDGDRRGVEATRGDGRGDGWGDGRGGDRPVGPRRREGRPATLPPSR